MPDALRMPATRVGDDLRNLIAARRERLRRTRFGLAIFLSALPLAATLCSKPPVLLVWNASASAPIGLYRVQRGRAVRRGDMVVARTPDQARFLAAARHYLPANVPLVKRVAAIPGDRVCAIGKRITINGAAAAQRLERDPRGRLMPWWSGCRNLKPGEIFLLMASPLSFDGRYFGITREPDLLGRAELLWAKPAKGSGDG